MEVDAELLEHGRVGLAVDLDVDQRLGLPVLGADLEQPALLVAGDLELRVHDHVDVALLRGQLHRHRVDEERHVVGDRLDDRMRALPTVLLDGRGIDVDFAFTRATCAEQAPVCERCAREIDVASGDDVLGCNVFVVAADESFELLCLGGLAPFSNACNRRFEGCRLRLVWLRRHCADPRRSALLEYDSRAGPNSLTALWNILRVRVAILVVLSIAALAASSASASPKLQLGITDSGDAYFANPKVFYPRLHQLHSQLLRVNLNWGGRLGVAQRRPEFGFDPDDPAYNWSRYDRIVLGADAVGVSVVFTIFGSPRWANGGKLPTRAPRKASDLQDFAFAAAERYAGDFIRGDGAVLPAVPVDSVNEPTSDKIVWQEAPSKKW